MNASSNNMESKVDDELKSMEFIKVDASDIGFLSDEEKKQLLTINQKIQSSKSTVKASIAYANKDAHVMEDVSALA